MKFRNLIILALLSSVVSGVIFYGCVRKKEDFIGPEYLSAPADFVASNLNVTPSVNFTTGVCTITADFSARVTYYVTITGLSSGAEKRFTGVNNMLDASSPGGTWNGSHDGLYFFRAGEQVNVKITFLRSDVFIEKTITLVAVRNLFASNPNLLPIGTLANVSYEASNVAGGFPLQFSFSESIANPDRISERVLAASYDIKAVHGLNVMRISGKSAQPDGFFVGGIQHRQGNQTTATAFLTPSDWSDASSLYFNVYIYGVPNSNAIVNLELHESDGNNPNNNNVMPKDTIKKECSGPQELNKFGHDPCTDDGWVYPITINFTGWKLVSVKFSDFQKSASAVNGGSGNGVREPTRIARAQMGVVSTPAFKTAAVMFDYPVMSYGAPFDPTK